MGLFEEINDSIFVVTQNIGNLATEWYKNDLTLCNDSTSSVAKALPLPTDEKKEYDVTHGNSSPLCVATFCCHPPESTKSRCVPDFMALSRSDLTDISSGLCLSAAHFLHAASLVKTTADAGFEEMCKRFVPYWRKRLDPEAWTVLASEIKPRLANIKVQNPNGGGR